MAKRVTRAFTTDVVQIYAEAPCADRETKIRYKKSNIKSAVKKSKERPYVALGFVEQMGFLILTLNCRYRTVENRDEDNWLNRLPHILALIWRVRPHVICFQETLRSQVIDLDLGLREQGMNYLAYGSDRTDKWALSDESNPIFYQKHLKPLEKRTISLGHGRIATHIRFPHLMNVVSTHWDHASLRARREQAETLAAYLKNNQFTKQHLIVAGDFNCGPTGTALESFLTETNLRATCQQGTFNNFDRSSGSSSKAVLDNICVPQEAKGSASIPELFLNGNKVFLSDHEPVLYGIN